MAETDITLTAATRLGGTDIAIGDNRITERADLAIVSIATPMGGEAALADALKSGWSLPFPSHIESTATGDTRAIRTSPDQMLLVFPHPTPDAEKLVRGKLGGTGYTTEQTDAWVIVEIRGPDTTAALERLCPLDIATFEQGASARTVMEHLGVLMVRIGVDRFWLMSASSSAESFLHTVETSYANVVD